MSAPPELQIETRPGVDRPAWATALLIWQALVAVGLVVVAVLLAAGRLLDWEGFGRWATFGLVATGAGFAVASVRWVLQRHHRGRLTAFILDYVVALLAGFLALQEVDAFNGLDALGEAFSKGIPFLLLVVFGWLVSGFVARFPQHEVQLRRVARWVMLAGAAAFLLAVGVLPALLEFFRRIIEPKALVYALVSVAGVFTAWLLWRDAAARWFGTTRQQDEVMNGLLFVSPNLIGFLAFFAGPLILSAYISFTDWDALGAKTWIGLDNYTRLFSLQFTFLDSGETVQQALKSGYVELFRIGGLLVGARDELFWIAMRNIVVFALVAVPLSVIPALFLASLLNTKLPGMKVFRAIYFLPSIAGVVGVALIWKQLYNASVGFLNYGILRFYDLINLLPGVDLTAPQPEWLSSPSTALLSVIIVFAWANLGFNTVLFLAGMQGIPGDLYEAAAIDGAGPWARFRKITVPMLRSTMVFVVTTTAILAMQLFNEPFILMAPQLQANGPNNATLSPVIYLYQLGFTRFNQGYASAVGWILFLLIFLMTIFYFRRQGEEGVLSA